MSQFYVHIKEKAMFQKAFADPILRQIHSQTNMKYKHFNSIKQSAFAEFATRLSELQNHKSKIGSNQPLMAIFSRSACMKSRNLSALRHITRGTIERFGYFKSKCTDIKENSDCDSLKKVRH